MVVDKTGTKPRLKMSLGGGGGGIIFFTFHFSAMKCLYVVLAIVVACLLQHYMLSPMLRPVYKKVGGLCEANKVF